MNSDISRGQELCAMAVKLYEEHNGMHSRNDVLALEKAIKYLDEASSLFVDLPDNVEAKHMPKKFIASINELLQHGRARLGM